MFACRQVIFQHYEQSIWICPRILCSGNFAFANVLLLEDIGYLMLFYHSRPAKRPRALLHCKAFAALASGVLFSLARSALSLPRSPLPRRRHRLRLRLPTCSTGPGQEPLVATDFSTPVGSIPALRLSRFRPALRVEVMALAEARIRLVQVILETSRGRRRRCFYRHSYYRSGSERKLRFA
jgi:hypothetical protein